MPIRTVDAPTLKIWLASNDAVLIDVREPAEYNAESIPHSILCPLANVCKAALPDYWPKKLVIHCRKGGRGSSACEKLLTEDPGLEIYNLEGGIESWRNAGLPVNVSGKYFLSLDRQVQLTVGLCVLTGSILGYYMNSLFFLFTGFFGAGLTFAGLTGFCGLAMLMAKMPWNQNKEKPASFCHIK